MKALDTPLLLDMLRGRAGAWRFLEKHRSEELATTEINLFELEALARAGSTTGREHRLAAVASLRRKITVLPIDDRAVAAAGRLSAGRATQALPTDWLMLGAAEAAGCSSWVTASGTRLPKHPGKLRAEYFANSHS
jgi:predicted nucleic acid-binding protein